MLGFWGMGEDAHPDEITVGRKRLTN